MEAVIFDVNSNFDDILANRFNSFADDLTKPCIVTLEIESYGGEVQSLEKIVDRIIEMKSQGFVFVTNVENYAYSCGFDLFLMGDMRFASDTAQFLFHPPTLEIWDRINVSDAKEIFDILEYAQNVSDKIILENSNISSEAFNLLKKNENFMDRNDLIFLGLMENEYSL